MSYSPLAACIIRTAALRHFSGPNLAAVAVRRPLGAPRRAANRRTTTGGYTVALPGRGDRGRRTPPRTRCRHDPCLSLFAVVIMRSSAGRRRSRRWLRRPGAGRWGRRTAQRNVWPSPREPAAARHAAGSFETERYTPTCKIPKVVHLIWAPYTENDFGVILGVGEVGCNPDRRHCHRAPSCLLFLSQILKDSSGGTHPIDEWTLLAL